MLLLATWLASRATKLGLVMRATQYDRETAQAFGIPVDRVYAVVFALGAMLAAVAAVLIVPIQQAHYLMGLDPLLLSFIVVIIGGLGSLRGTLVAALVIGLSDGIISVFFSPTLAKIVATLLVALVLVVRPAGLFGGDGAMTRAGRRASHRCCIAALIAVLFALQFVLPALSPPTSPASWCWRPMPSATICSSATRAFSASAMRCSSPPASTAPGSPCLFRLAAPAAFLAGVLAGACARAARRAGGAAHHRRRRS